MTGVFTMRLLVTATVLSLFLTGCGAPVSVAAPNPSPSASAVAPTLERDIRTQVIEYRDGDQVLEGFLAYDANQVGKRPGVLIVHEWVGINDYVRGRARQLAEMGYVAFAPDIYGKGVRPAPPTAAGQEAGKYRNNRALARSRMNAGLQVLRAQESVDTANLAAMGYCFGGTMTLELARSGADLKGFISFHGGLDSPTRDEGKNIKGKVLILHGADDPVVPDTDIAAFQKEMRDGNVDWSMVYYSKAVHAFSNPEAGNDPSRGSAYNAEADARSFEAMKDFFNEIF
jgi:dienelactone hydrolase